MRRIRRVCGVALLAIAPIVSAPALSATLRAQTAPTAQAADSASPPSIVTRDDVAALAAGTALAALAYQADVSVRRTMRSAAWQENGALGTLADIGNAYGQPGALVLGAALWGGGAAFGHRGTAAVGLHSIESVAVSGLITAVLKGAVGRARPRVSPRNAWDVEFGRGWSESGGNYSSLPSGHTSAAFSFAASVTSDVARRAPERALAVGVTTFGLAGATAFARPYRDAHWLSDVTMGAVIGTVSGLAVTRWHATRSGNGVDARLLPVASVTPDGRSMLGLSVVWPRPATHHRGQIGSR